MSSNIIDILSKLLNCQIESKQLFDNDKFIDFMENPNTMFIKISYNGKGLLFNLTTGDIEREVILSKHQQKKITFDEILKEISLSFNKSSPIDFIKTEISSNLIPL